MKVYQVYRPNMKTSLVVVMADSKIEAIKICHAQFGFASSCEALAINKKGIIKSSDTK